MELKLLNLPRNLTETDIKSMFSEYGTVLKCTLIKDPSTGTSKGFGFVEMDSIEAGNKAIEAFHKKKLKGSRIRVKAGE